MKRPRDTVAGPLRAATTQTDWPTLREHLRVSAQAHAAARAQTRAAQLQQAQEQQTWQDALQSVIPLAPANRVHLKPARPSESALLTPRANPKPAGDDLSDGLFEHSDATEPQTPWHRPDLGPNLIRRLARLDWPLAARLDLHGLTTERARCAVAAFIHEQTQAGARCVSIVHGKGLGSHAQTPILKTRVPHWLMQLTDVLAFCPAPARQGGSGATLVLLRARRQRL